MKMKSDPWNNLMFTAHVISLKKVQKQEVEFLDALASLDLKLKVGQ